MIPNVLSACVTAAARCVDVSENSRHDSLSIPFCLPSCCSHVMLPKDIAKLVPKTHLMSESEWRNLGVQQSQGWVHYMIHEPEPHILLFRRPLPKKPEK
nr:cyclin-dependent kinases regulatory subunit 1 [Pelodiscus sinensis]|eukprot:XP_025042472.1 cyclin-dependent kinases regulatory subunit 1 [Pelodiscus sinensis]